MHPNEHITIGGLLYSSNPAAHGPAYLMPHPDQLALVVFDPVNDVILHATSRVSLLTGYSAEELTSMPGTVIFGGAGRALLAGIHERMLRAGPGMVWGQILGIFDSAGGKVEFFCTLRLPPLARPDSGGVYQIIALDSGEIRSGEIRQDGHPREPGPNSRFVMEALQSNLWEYDVGKGMYFYGPQFADILGFDGVAGNQGKSFDDWIASVHPDDADHIQRQWRKLLKLGEYYRLPYRIRDVGGRWRWILSAIHAIINDSAGRPERILGFHIDITPAMNMETHLVESGERFRTVFNNVGVGIAVCEADGTVVQVNAAMSVVLGRDREHFIGKKLVSFAHAEDRGEIRANLARIAKHGRRECLRDTRFLRPDASVVWTNLTATLSGKTLAGERFVIVILEDVTPSRAEREKLQFEATHDVMTGCWNRWTLLERLEQHIRIAQRHRLPMAFAIGDLDHFKQVNDLHGHQTGDRVLVRFVEILAASVRETEVVGRYGGEEFAVVFPGTSVAGAKHSLRRALDALRMEEFVDGAGTPFRVTATFGVSGVTPDCTHKDVVAWADAALYRGKTRGRDAVVAARRGRGAVWL